MMDRAARAKYYQGIPVGTTPGFPAFVPDSDKCGALFYKASPGVDTVLYVYNCLNSTWDRYARSAEVVHKTGTESINGHKSFLDSLSLSLGVYGSAGPTVVIGDSQYGLSANTGSLYMYAPNQCEVY